MNNSLQYYMHDGPSAFRFELSGELTDEGARRLELDWLTASSVIGNRQLIVDMTYLTGAGGVGRALLARWHSEGAQLIAILPTSSELAESIVGQPLPKPAPSKVGDRTWLPFSSVYLGRAAALLVLIPLLFPAAASGATLKPETVAAWDGYLRTVDASLQERVRPGGSFLWTFEDAERAVKVRSGEIVVAAASGPSPRKTPGGLIHHWVGAAFVPDVKIDDMLDVTRDYDRYKEFYRPYVVESKASVRGGAEDRFSMQLMNKAMFMTMAFDVESQATNVRLDDRHFYTVSRSMRIQEIEGYGQPGESRKPEGEGGGYIWKLYSIARFEQRDEGVYVELEAIALSRDIPAAVRFLVEPAVKRLSRNSLVISLEQTEKAVGGRLADVTKSGGRSGAVRSTAFTGGH